MVRAKLIRLFVRLANSLSSAGQLGFTRRILNQVTHISLLTQSPPFSHSRKPHYFCIFPNSHQKLHFSSKPESSAELILCNDWSEEIENELEKLNPNLTHESVVLILRKLTKNPQKCLQFFKWVRDGKGFDPSYVPYCLLLRSLACREFGNEFWAVASEMKDKEFCIDEQIYFSIKKVLQEEKLDELASEWTKFYESLIEDNGENDVTKNVVEVILGSDWSERVESELTKLDFPLCETFLFKVIWKLREDPLKALKFFEWVKSDQKYEHNSVTYNAMARILSQHQLFGEFWDLVTQMRSEGYEIDSYVKIARFFKNEDCVKLFEFMMDGTYKLSEQEFTWLLKILANDPDPDINLITRVSNNYVEMGNTVTKAIFGNIHKALCKVGRFDDAKKIVDDMKNAGYQSDDLTYNQEVFGLCKLGMFEDASLVINRMEAMGCIADIKTWTLLIKGYCAAGEVDQALSCFSHMREKRVKPDDALLQILIDGFLSHNKLLGAHKFLVEMVYKTHVRPWLSTYKLMIEKLVQGGKLEEAIFLLSMMKQQNYAPYPKPVGVYISKFGTVEDANKLLKALSLNGSPPIAAYVHIISSFFEEGRHSEAKYMLESSPQPVHHQKKIRDMFGLAQNRAPN